MRRMQSPPLKGTVISSRDTMVGSDTPQRASATAYSFPGSGGKDIVPWYHTHTPAGSDKGS